MALFYLLLFPYCFGVAWGLTISVGNSSTVSASYHNSTTRSLVSNTAVLQTTTLSVADTTIPQTTILSVANTTIPHTTTLSADNVTVLQTTASSVRHDGPYLSSGFTTSASARASGYGVLPMTDHNGNTTRSFPTAYLPPNSTTFNSTKTTTIDATGFGFNYASSCESFTRQWRSTSSKWFSSNSYSSMAVNTMRVTTVLYSENVVPATLTSCLGQSRMIGGQTLAQLSTSMTVETQLYSYLTPVAPPYTIPQPTCGFGTDSCNFLWDEYDAYERIRTSVWPATPTVAKVFEPLCKPYRPNAYCDQCTIDGNFVDMYYWPMEAVGEPCDPERSFITAAPTIPGQPNTIVFGTNTFTSPTVYLSVDYLTARHPNGRHCGGKYSSKFLPLRPEDVSSIQFSVIEYGNATNYYTWDEETTTIYRTVLSRNFSITATATVPVSFGDFMGAVPAAAYSAQSPLIYPGMPPPGTIITDAKYKPRIYLPEGVRFMDPYWSNCELYLHGISDPPVALTKASTINRPVLPTWSTTVDIPVPSGTTSAEPAGQPETPHASITQPSSTAGPAETGGPVEPVEPSRSSTRVNPSSVDPPMGGQSSQGSSPQNPLPSSVPSNGNSGSSGIPGPIAALPSSASPQANADSTKDQQSITPTATSRQATMTITLGSSRLPVVQSGSVAVVGDRTLTVGGSPVVIQGQQISLEPSGLRVESSETVHLPPAPTQTSPATAPTTAVWINGKIRVTVTQEKNAVVLTSGTQTTTIAFGNSATFNGHRVEVPFSGGMIFIDDSMIVPITLEIPSVEPLNQLSGSSVPVSGSSIPLPGSSVQFSLPSESGEKTITVDILADNRVRLISGSESIVVANGASAVFAGSTVTILADGSGVVVSGTSLIPLPIMPLPHSKDIAAEKLQNDYLSAVDSGRYIVVGNADNAVRLADGAVTVVGGHTVSVAGDGSYIVVDGSVTQSVLPGATGMPEGEGGRVVEDVEAASGAVSSGSVGPLISAMCTWRTVLMFSVLFGMMMT